MKKSAKNWPTLVRHPTIALFLFLMAGSLLCPLDLEGYASVEPNPSVEEHVMILTRGKKKMVYGVGMEVKAAKRDGKILMGTIQHITPDSMQIGTTWITFDELKRIKNKKKKAVPTAIGVLGLLAGLGLAIGSVYIMSKNFSNYANTGEDPKGTGCILYLFSSLFLLIGVIALALTGMTNVDRYVMEVIPASELLRVESLLDAGLFGCLSCLT